MARPSNPDLLKKWKVALPATLAGQVELLLLDPITGRPRYASRSHLVARLLADWVEENQPKPAKRTEEG